MNLSEEQSPKKKVGKFLFEKALEKKMFFGNYKPRYLTIEKIEGSVIMAYRYIPSKKIKNEFELNLNDYAVGTKKIWLKDIGIWNSQRTFRMQFNACQLTVMQRLSHWLFAAQCM